MTKTIEAPLKIKEVVTPTQIKIGGNTRENKGKMSFKIDVVSLGQHNAAKTIEMGDASNASCADASCPPSSCNVPNTDARAATCQYTCWNGCRR